MVRAARAKLGEIVRAPVSDVADQQAAHRDLRRLPQTAVQRGVPQIGSDLDR